jgi:hypothetical protein
MRLGSMLLLLLSACASSVGSAAKEDGVVSAKVAKGPFLDGKADDEAWSAATPVQLVSKGVFPANKDKSTAVVVRSVHTDTHVYLVIRWKDETKDDQAQKPWTWDAGKNAYVEGPEREDALAVAFELTGTFNPDMLAGVESMWDVWHWKASRTNPQGYAMDRSHRYSKEQWQGKGKSHKDRSGESIWIARPEDAGDTVEMKQAAPATKGADKVPQYLPGTPSGSAADVKAKGGWTDGWWTLELERKLDTGYPDDTKFSIGQTYKMAISTHDRTGDMDKATEAIVLTFGK